MGISLIEQEQLLRDKDLERSRMHVDNVNKILVASAVQTHDPPSTFVNGCACVLNRLDIASS